MDYNFIEIGERIRGLRKERKLSQEGFIELLHDVTEMEDGYGFRISRNRLSRIENGTEADFSLELLLAVCKVCRCDMGFLLGEYSRARSIEAREITRLTGLSDKAIQVLRYMSGLRNDCNWRTINLLNRILEAGYDTVLQDQIGTGAERIHAPYTVTTLLSHAADYVCINDQTAPQRDSIKVPGLGEDIFIDSAKLSRQVLFNTISAELSAIHADLLDGEDDLLRNIPGHEGEDPGELFEIM